MDGGRGPGAVLRGPAQVVRWNSDKRSFQWLWDGGCPGAAELVRRARGGADPPRRAQDFVLEPVMSASAQDTARYTRDQRAAAERHLAMLHAAGKPALVRPYLPQIAQGERALVFLDGRFSHAIRKGPVLVQTGVIDNDRMPHPDLTRHDPPGRSWIWPRGRWRPLRPRWRTCSTRASTWPWTPEGSRY